MQFVQICLLFLNLGVAFSAPNHLKTEVLETNEIPSVSVGAGGVSASWGGYSAKAGLGGNSGLSGGLFASADSPHGSAAAGLGGRVGDGDAVSGGLGASASSPYGGSASAGLGGTTGVNTADTVSGSLGASASSPYGGSAGAGLGGISGTTSVKHSSVQGSGLVNTHASAGTGNAGGVPYVNSGVSSGTTSTGGHTQVVYNNNKKPGGLIDNIFNIPISVLQAVNGLLNQQQGHGTKNIHGNRHNGPVVDNRSSFSQSASSATVYEQHPQPEHPTPIAGNGGPVGPAGATVTFQKRPVNYDNIFNIPISALRAVNKLLNDGAASISKSIQVQGGSHASHNYGGSAQVSQSHAQSYAGSSQIPQSHSVNAQSASNTANFEGSIHVEKGNIHVPQAYTAQKPAGFYDNVFNIPITALKSVNQLLNG